MHDCSWHTQVYDAEYQALYVAAGRILAEALRELGVDRYAKIQWSDGEGPGAVSGAIDLEMIQAHSLERVSGWAFGNESLPGQGSLWKAHQAPDDSEDFKAVTAQGIGCPHCDGSSEDGAHTWFEGSRRLLCGPTGETFEVCALCDQVHPDHDLHGG